MVLVWAETQDSDDSPVSLARSAGGALVATESTRVYFRLHFVAAGNERHADVTRC